MQGIFSDAKEKNKNIGQGSLHLKMENSEPE